MSDQTITLGVITFNEGALLKKLLSQISKYVDEIVIVDSFSTDETIEVAESFGAKIIRMNFNGSYSELRNMVIKFSTSDYILMLDCDETLQKPEEFFQMIFAADANFLPRYNYTNGNLMDTDKYPDRQGRMFKNNGKVKYYRNVHELLTGYETCEDLNTWIIHDRTSQSVNLNHRRYAEILAMGDNE